MDWDTLPFRGALSRAQLDALRLPNRSAGLREAVAGARKSIERRSHATHGDAKKAAFEVPRSAPAAPNGRARASAGNAAFERLTLAVRLRSLSKRAAAERRRRLLAALRLDELGVLVQRLPDGSLRLVAARSGDRVALRRAALELTKKNQRSHAHEENIS